MASREPMEQSGLLSCALLRALGGAWGELGSVGAPDAGPVREVEAGGAREVRSGPAGIKGGAVTLSRSGELRCGAARGPREAADAAGSGGDAACAAAAEGCDVACSC